MLFRLVRLLPAWACGCCSFYVLIALISPVLFGIGLLPVM